MLEEYGKQNKKEIKFVHQGKLEAYDSTIGLTLFRIIQYQLKVAQNCGANKISITIKTSHSIKLVLSDDGRNPDAMEPERKILLRHMETRLSLVKGTIKVGIDKKGHNVVEIEIPLPSEPDDK
jgi:signal transduction histidine kinase